MDFDGSSLNLLTLKELFKKTEDVIFHHFEIQKIKLTFIFCEEMIDQQLIFSFILPTLEKHIEKANNSNEIKWLTLTLPDLKKLKKSMTLLQKSLQES